MLAAADRLFLDATPEAAVAVTMDAVAAAAGVGKGTLFRAFGDRDGLLDALSAAKFEPVRSAVEAGSGRFAASRGAAQRAVAFLDSMLTFKIENANLMRAREAAGESDLRSARYRWMHDHLRTLVVEAAPRSKARAPYVAHALLATLRIELLDELVGQGCSVADLRRRQAEHVRALIPGSIVRT